MKNLSQISLGAVFAVVSIALAFAAARNSPVLYSVGPCAFLLLTAIRDYGRKTRYQVQCGQFMSQPRENDRAAQPLRLAA